MSLDRDPALHLNRQRADSFGDEAALYDRVRPTYPGDLVNGLMASSPRTVLDVGCGTGITARLFAARGCEVLGVEPDPRMAAKARHSGLTVEESAFEAWDPEGRRFDLLVAGQSWHWVEPVAGLGQAARAVVAGGRIGLFWNDSFPQGDALKAIEGVYEMVAPDLGQRAVALGRSDGSHYDRLGQSIADAGQFVDVQVVRYSHAVHYDTADWLDLLRTHSDHHTLPAAKLAELLGAMEPVLTAVGGVPVRYVTTLVTGIRATT